MVKRQHGFSAIEIILILILVGLIGFGAWYVWRANTSPTSTAVDQPETTPTTVAYDRYGLTFKYPVDWKLDAQDDAQSIATTLTSPDYKVGPDATVGQSITIDEAIFLESNLTAENFRAKQVDAHPNEYSDYKELDINGNKAVQFYSGDSRTTVFFMPSGKYITFTLDTFPTRDAASAAYDQVIESVVIH